LSPGWQFGVLSRALKPPGSERAWHPLSVPSLKYPAMPARTGNGTPNPNSRAMDTPTAPKRKTDMAVPPDLPPFLLVFVSSDAATHAPSDSFQIDRYDLFMKKRLKRRSLA